MEYLINKLKTFGVIEQDSVEGYILMNDDKSNKSLVMVKKDDTYWKTEWISKTDTTIKTPKDSFASVVKSN